jgi:hypothetical protein
MMRLQLQLGVPGEHGNGHEPGDDLRGHKRGLEWPRRTEQPSSRTSWWVRVKNVGYDESKEQRWNGKELTVATLTVPTNKI